MLTKRLLLFSFLSLILSTIFVGCKEKVKPEEPKIKEGEVHFELTYPYYEDAFMASIMPDEMVMTFKDNVYKNCVSQGGLFSTTLIADCNNQTLIMILDLGPKKIYSELDKSLTDTMLLMYPIPDIERIREHDSVAGAYCEKKLAIFDNLKDGFDVELYETEDIDIENSNWCNQYGAIDGVLLGYEVEQYGIQMRFNATSIDTVKVDDSAFDIPEGFKKVPLERMLYELEEIFKSFSY